jgi:hypothetical protein
VTAGDLAEQEFGRLVVQAMTDEGRAHAPGHVVPGSMRIECHPDGCLVLWAERHRHGEVHQFSYPIAPAAVVDVLRGATRKLEATP